MAVIAGATKTVSFKGPYTGKTYQDLTSVLLGRDGYLAGGVASDNGSLITIQLVTFVQRGIVATTKAVISTIPVPTVAGPWFVLGSIPDDDLDSGVAITATADLGSAITGVLLAFKLAGRWHNPTSANIAAAAIASAELGVERGGDIAPTVNGTGDLTAVKVFKGVVTDPDGRRRTLPSLTTNSALLASLAPARPHPTKFRTDYAVVRQREDFTAEAIHVMGGTVTESPVAPVDLETVAAPAKRAGHYAKRGGSLGQQWFAWGDNTLLRIKGGPAGEGFATATLLSGVGQIRTTVIVGQRASDNAVILLYLDNLTLRLVSFNPTTGAQINAPVTLVVTGGTITHVRALLDGNEKVHIVFENDEATQQIYYMRCTIATGSFATIDMTPRYAAGAVTGTNDTWPSLGINRAGLVTIAYIQGTGANEHGDMRVATYDASGNRISLRLLAAATNVGVDPIDADTGLVGAGAVATAFLNLRRTAVVVTPHDETYVFTLGLSTGSDVDYVLMHRHGFADELGFELVNVLSRNDAGNGFAAIAAAAGEQGEICVVIKNVAPANLSKYLVATLDSRPLEIGKAGQSSLRYFEDNLTSATETSGFTDLLVTRGPNGSFVVNHVIDLTVTTIEAHPLTIVPGSFGPVSQHPKDLYLGSWVVPPGAAALIDAEARTFDIFNTRPKRMNYPFLVGNQGDFQGWESLNAAIAAAGRDGGEVVVRSGRHTLMGVAKIFGGISIRGEGRSVVVVGDANNDGAFHIGDLTSITVVVAGNIVSSTNFRVGRIQPGSVVLLNNLLHTVLRNLGFDGTNYRILVDDFAATAPSGIAMKAFVSGMRIENLTLTTKTSSSPALIALRNCYQAALRSLRFEENSTGEPMILLDGCRGCVVDDVDLTALLVNITGAPSITLQNGDRNLLRNVRLADTRYQILIESTEQNPRLEECSGDANDGTAVAFNITAGRTTPVLFDNCRGRLQGDPLGASSLAARALLDTLGDLKLNGEYFFDDFYQFPNEALWDLSEANVGDYQTINPALSTTTAALSHVVRLLLTAGTATAAHATLLSAITAAKWASVPFLRMRVKLGDLTSNFVSHTFGFDGVAYFLHDKGNIEGLGGSSQLQFVLVNQAPGDPLRVLTGFTPVTNTYYWFWIARKSDTEAYWGISDDLTGKFLKTGSFAVAASTVRVDAGSIIAKIKGNGGAVSGPNPDHLFVDAVEYRAKTRQSDLWNG